MRAVMPLGSLKYGREEKERKDDRELISERVRMGVNFLATRARSRIEHKKIIRLSAGHLVPVTAEQPCTPHLWFCVSTFYLVSIGAHAVTQYMPTLVLI